MIYINNFLHNAKAININASGDKITDEAGNERRPELTTAKNLCNTGGIFYEKRGGDLWIECLNKTSEQIIEFIKKNNLHE